MDNELQPIQIKITTSGANEAVKSINSVTSALKELQNIAKISTNLMSNFGNTITKNKISNTFNVGNTISQTSESSKKASKNIKHFSTNLAKLGITFWSVDKSAKMLRQAMDESASWVENLNVMEVAFGGMSESAYQFTKSVSQGLGLDSNEMLEYVSLFQQMASAMGQTTETAYMMSTALTLLGTDIASLYNKDTRVTMEALRSAIAGQVKPVRQFGFDITSYSIDALIEEMGILSGYTSRMMTQAQKQLARTILLIQQSRNAWGDLSKTINTYSNQQKILQAQFTNLKRAIGDLFVGAEGRWGIATELLYRINGVLMAIVETIRVFIPQAESSGFNEMGKSAKDAKDDLEDLNEELNSSLLSFDKFNTLSSGENKGNDYITLALQNKLAKEYSDYMAEWNSRMEKVESTAHKIRDSIMEWLGFVKNVSTYTKLIREETEDTPAIYAEYTEVNWALGEGQTRIKIIRDFINEIASTIKTIANGIRGVFASFLSNESFRRNISDVFMLIQKIIRLLFDADKSILPHIIEKFLQLANSILPVITNFIDVIVDIVTQIFSNKEIERLFDNIVDMAGIILPMIVKFLTPVVNLVGKLVDLLSNILLPGINDLLEAFNKIESWFDSWATPAMEKILDFISWIVDAINKFAKAINIFGNDFYGRFANGGYPDRGQMFIANENGAELVGNIGGRTAVANNDMITQAIENAAYNGMIRAATSTNGTNNINLKIDANSNDLSRALAKSMIMEFQRQGYNLKG